MVSRKERKYCNVEYIKLFSSGICQRGDLTVCFQLVIASFTFVLLKVLFLWVDINSASKNVQINCVRICCRGFIGARFLSAVCSQIPKVFAYAIISLVSGQILYSFFRHGYAHFS